jgi:sec-independent protein translocase protein TatB
MGGLGPGIGGGEWLVIGVVALLVVGPERLPGLLRQLGKWVAKARGMANEFRSSFDEMARQSELDDLRKEVEALRTGQPVRLGAEADAAFKDIKSEFDRPLFADPVMTPAASEWPDGEPVILPVADSSPSAPVLVEAAPDVVAIKPKAPRKPRAAKTAAQPVAPAAPAAKPRKAAPRKPATPRNSKIDL